MKELGIKTGFYKYNENEKEFNFFLDINVTKKITFVSNVVDLVVGDTYLPFLRDMMFDYQLVAIFSDVFNDDEFSDVNESNQIDLNFIEDFIESTKVVDIIKANINQELLKELNDSVDKAIEYKTGIKKNDNSEIIYSILNSINKTIENFGNMDMGAFTRFVEQVASMNGGVNTDSLVKAYMKSDDFLKNRDEVLEAKNKRIVVLENAVKELLKEKKG